MKLNRNLTIAILLSLPIWLVIVGLLWWWSRPPKPLTEVVTLAIAGRSDKPVKVHREPFGIAVDDDGNIFVSEGVTGSIYRIPAAGYLSTAQSQNETAVAEQLETPSAIVFDDDGNLIVANTGAHTIIRIDLKNNLSSVIAGADGISGFADGRALDSRFNGPVGIAVAEDGTIYIADTYNDRIRQISRDGQVSTLAGGGEPGYTDGVGAEARFDTPCGIAIDDDGTMLVADTGNHRIRRVELNGRVTTIAGTGEDMVRDGAPLEAAFSEPTAIAVRDKNSFYVSDTAGSAVRMVVLGEKPSVVTLAGGYPNGLVDDALNRARLNRPSGIALLPDGELVFADSGNGLVRAFVPAKSKMGHRTDPKTAIIQMSEMGALIEPRWPFDPPQARRDISGTFGEIRGERLPDHDAWFHSGLDVAGAYGETVLAVFSERVTRPISVSGAGGPRERLRLPLFEYVHMRVGRDRNDLPIGNFANGATSLRLDAQGQVTGVRLRRGTRINAGDPIGTLNRLNHIHLNAGPAINEFNALSVLKLPGLEDTVAPVIETVTIKDRQNGTIFESNKTAKVVKPIEVSGNLRITVRAYDRVDGNARYRRLGVYRLGYQVFNADGSHAPDFRAPRYNITFDRLPADPNGVLLAYAEGSQSGYQDATIFDYIVTNIVRGGETREDFLDSTKIPPGECTLRVVAEDYFGNQARRDLKIRVRR